MKDYKKYAIKIGKMENFGEIHNCGYPAKHFPVNLYFELAKNPACRMYVGYYSGKWQIEYTTDENIRCRGDMIRTRRFKTDKEMYAKVQEVIGILSKAKSTTHLLG